MILPLAPLYAILGGALRLGIFWALVPPFSFKGLPMQVRAAFALCFGFFGYVNSTAPWQMPQHSLDCLVHLLQHAWVGFVLGLSVRLVFGAIELAGSLLSNEIGLSMASTFDPTAQSTSTTLGTLLSLFASLLVFVSGAYRDLLWTVFESFNYAPNGFSQESSAQLEGLAYESLQIFALGLKLAAPLVAFNFLLNLAFAILGKAAPKVNVFVISFAARILGGMALFMLACSLLTAYLYEALRQMPLQLVRWLAP